MLDTLLDLLERDKKTSKNEPGQKRSFRDRLAAVVEGDGEDDSRTHREPDARTSPKTDDDDDSRERKQAKRGRFADLLEFD